MSFPTTHWSVLAKATLGHETEARAALDQLCRRYWGPLNQFIRSRGYGEADAADLTQDFLLHVLEHSTLRVADPAKGLFRSFLLGALTRSLHDEYDRRHAQKRGAGAPHLSLDEHQVSVPGADRADTSFFDREWALTILESTLEQAQKEIEFPGNAQLRRAGSRAERREDGDDGQRRIRSGCNALRIAGGPAAVRGRERSSVVA